MKYKVAKTKLTNKSYDETIQIVNTKKKAIQLTKKLNDERTIIGDIYYWNPIVINN